MSASKYSREYLEEHMSAAKKVLPAWQADKIHQQALPRAGGRANGRKADGPSSMDRIAMRRLAPEDLSSMEDNDLLAAWSQMQAWYSSHQDAALYAPANALMAEMDKRGLPVDRTQGLGADAAITKSGDLTVLESLGEALGFLASSSGCVARPMGCVSQPTPLAKAADLLVAARRAFDRGGGLILEDVRKSSRALLSRGAYADVGAIVPSVGPVDAPVAFVGAIPSALDAARGEPFTGDCGAVLRERYLAPLALAKQDVFLTNVIPLPRHDGENIFDGWIERELAHYRPRIVVALGKIAKAALGDLADFYMPHPGSLKHFDSGEVARKMSKVRIAIQKAPRREETVMREVGIAKANAAKQIVYGVALDPYQIDTQDDWVPAAEIEKAAHDYMASSRTVGLQHVKKADAVVVESYLVQYPSQLDYDNAMANLPHRAYRMPYGDQVVHSGAWILGTRINDPALWARVEKGDIGAYSIGGTSMRIPMHISQMPKVQFLDMMAEMTPNAPPPSVASIVPALQSKVNP